MAALALSLIHIYVVIRHENGLETVYGHLSKQIVDENQYVEAGEPVSYTHLDVYKRQLLWRLLPAVLR